MVYGIVSFLKSLYAYLWFTLKLRGKKVMFKGLPTLNRKVVFEGYNAVYPGAVVKNSFLGAGTYIGSGTKVGNTRIGRFCTIADNVRISLGRHPSDTFVSIHPAFFSTHKQGGFTFVDETKFEEHVTAKGSQYFVEIGHDVWIGNNVLIMDGVTIGNGAIIAAGAVVTKDVAPYSIVGGLPAKFIKWRFTQEQIEKLEKLQWWEKDIQWLKENSMLFEDIDCFINALEPNTIQPKTSTVC
jgi:acetyltransferase-like isoleucine patch superfamily enzyme